MLCEYMWIYYIILSLFWCFFSEWEAKGNSPVACLVWEIFYYPKPLKSTNLTELCQISLGRRWIRKSNKLTKSKVNPNGTPMYVKLCFGKFCFVKDEETPCGRNSQNIFKVVLNTTKNTHASDSPHVDFIPVGFCRDTVSCFERRPNDVRATYRTTSKGIKTQTFGFICFHVPFILLSFPLISFHCPFMFLSFSFHFLSFPFIVLSCSFHSHFTSLHEHFISNIWNLNIMRSWKHGIDTT